MLKPDAVFTAEFNTRTDTRDHIDSHIYRRGTDIPQASKRGSIFLYVCQGVKQASAYVRQGDWDKS